MKRIKEGIALSFSHIIITIAIIIIFIAIYKKLYGEPIDSVEASFDQYYSYSNEYISLNEIYDGSDDWDNDMKIYVIKDKEYDKEYFIILNIDLNKQGNGTISVVERNKGSD